MSIPVKYPHVLSLTGRTGIIGSLDYQATQGNRNFQLGEVIAITNPELDPSVHTGQNNAKNFDVLEFENGVKLRLKFWIQYYTINGNAYQAVTGSACFVNQGTEWIPQSWNLGGASGYSVGAASYVWYCPYNAANTYGIKLVLFNDYTSAGVVVPDITMADGLRLVCMIPVETTQTPGTIKSFAQWQDNVLLKVSTSQGTQLEDPTWAFYPPIAPGSAADVSAGMSTVLYYRDLNQLLSAVNHWGSTLTIDDIIEESNPDDPTQETDPSQPGGGQGNYDDTSDPIDFPALPTGGALSSGAIKAFAVSPAIMQQVFNKLWDSSIFDIPLQFQKLVDNPIDCIISFHCIPVAPSTSGQGNIKLGNLDTEQVAPIINNQYLTVDCGSLNIKEFWGSALDYSPYTKCELYMPFIGIKELKIEDVMKSTVHIKYNIDIFTGDCLCNVKCGQSVLYKFAGNLKQDIPVSGRTNNMGVKGMIGIAASFAGGAMGAAMGAPPVLAGVAAGISSAASVASSKIITTRSGSLSGSVGLLDDFRPFFIFHRPVQSLAKNFKSYKGYPSNITYQLSAVSGYTEVEYINLQNITNATSEEMDEIKSLLKNGVLI